MRLTSRWAITMVSDVARTRVDSQVEHAGDGADGAVCVQRAEHHVPVIAAWQAISDRSRVRISPTR